MGYQHINVPVDGDKITANADMSLNIPDHASSWPTVPSKSCGPHSRISCSHADQSLPGLLVVRSMGIHAAGLLRVQYHPGACRGIRCRPMVVLPAEVVRHTGTPLGAGVPARIDPCSSAPPREPVGVDAPTVSLLPLGRRPQGDPIPDSDHKSPADTRNTRAG